VNASAELVAETPPGVVTVTATVIAPLTAGVTAVKVVAELTLNEAAALDPKSTAVAPVKFVPVMVTEVPPAVEPEDGLTFVTVGGAGGVTPVPATISTATPPDIPLGLCVAVGCTAAETLTS
jgi:hypothetical protein